VRKLFLLMLLMLFAAACTSPTVIQKCQTDYKLQGDKVVGTYTECITQNPSPQSTMTLKHKELYD